MSKKVIRLLSVVAAAVFLLVTLSAFRSFQNHEPYPDPDQTRYRLPYSGERWVPQGNHSLFTHKGRLAYSYDFYMPTGTPIHTARAGVVVDVLASVKGIGNFAGNRVVILHEDSTRAYYVHLKHEAALVSVGERVDVHQVIGLSGMTGRSIYPHLHFHVEREGTSIPISFSNVNRHGGIPRMFCWY